MGAAVAPSVILESDPFEESEDDSEWETDPSSTDAPVTGQLVPTRRTARRRALRTPPPRSQWSLPAIGGASFLAIVAAILAYGWLQAQSPDPAQVAKAAAPRSPAPATVIEPPPRQQWLGRRQASWAFDGSKTITFDLQASEDVPVWMTRVRPQLTVRCVSRATEVFVSLGSAASVEQQTGSHTVRLQIDDDPVVEQQWTDSTTSHELFSPDGLLLTRRLADAHRMRFGFTPYNAQPVVADFTVQGFDELAPLVAKTCGWQLDDDIPIYQPARSARLK